MALKNDLSQDLKDAMRSGDTVKKSTIRLVLAAIKNAEVNRGSPLDDPDILGVIQKEVKSRNEAMDFAKQGGRADLVDAAKAEIAVLEAYLPQGLSEKEIETLVDEALSTTGATSMREIGAVMGYLMPKIKGRADGKEVSALVRARLQ